VGGIDGEYVPAGPAAAKGSAPWAEAFISSHSQSSAAAIAATADGGAVVVGQFTGTLASGAHPLGANDDKFCFENERCPDGFVVKLAPDGAVQWSTGLHGFDHDAAVAVAVDEADDSIVVGYQCVGDSSTFDVVFAGKVDICLARYESSKGQLQHVISFGGPEDDWLYALVVYDRSVYIGGRAGGDMPTAKGLIGEQAFVMRLNHDFDANWAQGYGDADASVMAMAAAADDLIIAGRTVEPIDFEGGGNPVPGNSMFVVRLNRHTGGQLWSTAAEAVLDVQGNGGASGQGGGSGGGGGSGAGGSGPVGAWPRAVAANGKRAVVAGLFRGPTNFQPTMHPTGDDGSCVGAGGLCPDGFVIHIDSDTKNVAPPVRIDTVNGYGYVSVEALALDGEDVLLGGVFHSKTATMLTGPMSVGLELSQDLAGSAQSFVARVDQKGNPIAHQVFGSSTATEELSSITLATAGNLLAAGRIQGPAELAGKKYSSSNFSAFVLNLGALQ